MTACLHSQHAYLCCTGLAPPVFLNASHTKQTHPGAPAGWCSVKNALHLVQLCFAHACEA